MTRLQRLVVLLCGSDPRLRRMLQYWAATCLLYVICIGLLLVQSDRAWPIRKARIA